MEITEVRIKLMEEAGERLQAFCSITFDDCFVIRDLKIIEGTNGPFVAMPSRKLTAHCSQCGTKNHLRAAYCNHCGLRLNDERATKDEDGRAKLYADIAHPINSACREMIQDRIIRAFYEEVERSKLPGYVSSYEDFDHEDFSAAALSVKLGRREATTSDRRIDPSHAPTTGGQQRGPHKSPSRPTRPIAQPSRPDSFGAGIF